MTAVIDTMHIRMHARMIWTLQEILTTIVTRRSNTIR